ncbi:hypothetical protein EB155_07300 [archaeon]|nr:hypothetical protein [archaeon]NDB55308.1 hypothetical protein [archaeon]NDB79658.1 hypothetical protein [archaeon]NDF28352.1 hypothetical protein [archaeon]
MEKLTFKEFLAKYWLINFVYGFLLMLLGPIIFSILGAIINSGGGQGLFEIFWSLFSVQIYFYPFYYFVSLLMIAVLRYYKRAKDLGATMF